MGVWSEYAVPAGWVEPQNNTLELTLPEPSDRKASLADLSITFGRDKD